jgi:RNA polymerase sigma-70 factor (ECF subfamily)
MEAERVNASFTEVQFGKLFRDHFKELCFTALRYTKDLETAREIVQESYLHLWEKREYIDPGRSVKAYLAMAVRNRALNWLRDHKKFDRTLLSFEGINPDAESEPADRLVEGEIRVRIEEAIGELPEKCREVFVLNRYRNLKYQEIADQLEISVKTVETQMSKALQHMRVRLKEFLPLILLLAEKIFREISG